MGADAEVFIFDHKRYIDVVVPAVKSMFTGTVLPEWWEAAIREQYGASNLDLVDCGEEIIGALRCGVPAPDHVGIYPDLSAVPFHKERAHWLSEEVRDGIEIAIKTCLGDYQFVGRSARPLAQYIDLLNKGDAEYWYYNWRHLVTLLYHLGHRGDVIRTHIFDDDGIHGWLDPAETLALIEWTGELSLPPVEPSFDAMRAAHQACRKSAASNDDWHRLSFAFLRATAIIASREGKGILWGHDL